MAFKITITDGQPIWDSLPVAKIADYPLEPRDYKPFAQARLCITPESIFVRLWSFEALPSDSSTLCCKLNLFPALSQKYISLSASFGGQYEFFACEGSKSTPLAAYQLLPRVKTFTAEDLQGIYWGVLFDVPRTLLTALYATNALLPGTTVRGNLYKTDKSACSQHFGSFYPVDFLDETSDASRYFGDFDLVAY